MSRAATEIATAELDEILRIARERNGKKNITGMLLYHEGSFIQVLEGVQNAVESLYETICLDKRHEHANVVLRTEVAERAFDQWAMGYKRTNDLDDIPQGFHHFLQKGYTKQKDSDNEAARKALLSFRDGRWRI